MNYNSLQNFLTFKQGYNPGLGKAPHKPILMLSVIEAIEREYINENIILINPELVSLFKSYWKELVVTPHTENFALPFYHLSNEKSGIWELVLKPDFDNALTKSKSIKSFRALKNYVYFAKLNSEFFKYLKDKNNREKAKEQILNRYFDKDYIQLHNTYLDEYESELINEDPELYKAKIKRKTIEAQEEYEEEIFIRRGAFKKAIPKVYSNTCAITGLSVSAEYNVSMIDACHIIPFSESHDDTIGNGIALCPNMHRAFDRGLISIGENYEVLISKRFTENPSIYSLNQFENKQIILPKELRLYPKQVNLDEHRNRFGFN